MDNSNAVKEQLIRHTTELKQRINACTRDELEVICDAIAETNYDIMLGSIYKAIYIRQVKLDKLREDL